MAGGIYSREKCPICGLNLRDTGRWMACKDHPNQRSDRGIYVKAFGLTRRYDRNYAGAQRFVTGVRFKKDEGSFDKRDYAFSRPLAFDNLIAKWLEYKKDEVSAGYYQHLIEYSCKATAYFGGRSIRDVDFAALEDFSKSLTVGNKTKHNIMRALHHFFAWCKYREDIGEIPRFPVIRFQMGYRQVVGKDTQIAIVEEVRRIAPMKVWLAIRWLCTYINVRPAEMVSLKEGHIDLENGFLLFPTPKERRYKPVPLTLADTEILTSFPLAFSKDMLFFRHDDGSPFGRGYLYKTWKRACKNLGVEGVDLYGGTRHSSSRALGKLLTPEKVKRSLGSRSNAVSDRYFSVEFDEVQEVFSQAIPAPSPHHNLRTSKIGKGTKLKD